jgi:hypothetical protein
MQVQKLIHIVSTVVAIDRLDFKARFTFQLYPFLDTILFLILVRSTSGSFGDDFDEY